MSSLPQHAAPLTVMQVVPRLKLGGVERGTIEFAIYLKQQGHRPVVVSHGGPLVATLVSHGIEHIEVNVEKKSFKSLFSIRTLRQLMIDLKVDIVHARSRIPAWLCYLALRKINSDRPAFVTTLHGLHSVNTYSSIMARSDQVIAVSQTAMTYLQQHFQRHLKQPPVVIYRGIDEQFSFGYQPSSVWVEGFKTQNRGIEHTKTVLMPGRLSQLKGFEYLLTWLKSAQDDQKLLLTAEPEDSNYCRKLMRLLRQNKVADRVVWLGIERDMPDLYAAVDLVVSVNRKAESFGRTVLEALSVGTPVVAFAHGGVAEIMEQLYPEGMVAPGDVGQLSQTINTFLLGAPPVKPHNKFRNQTMFEKTVAVYNQLAYSAHD